MTPFDAKTLKKIDKIKNQYPKGKQKSALIPVLHIAQQVSSGWLDKPILDYVAQLLDITPIEVYEVASFYTMFNLQPVGKNILEVCQTGPCMLRGSDDIIDYIKEKLDIEIGQTTQDGQFTLKTVECLGACGYAPMLQLRDYYVEHLTKEKVDELIEMCLTNQQISYEPR